jgi:hypothetical protein
MGTNAREVIASRADVGASGLEMLAAELALTAD